MSTLTEAQIEVGAYIETVTDGGPFSDDSHKAGVVKEIVEETKNLPGSTIEQTFVILTNGEDEYRIAIGNLTKEEGRVEVVEFRAANNEDDDEDDQEIVADGGEDVTDHVEDETIEDAIDHHDDPDHPDATTVEEARDALAWVQRSLEEHWSDWLTSVENNESTVVYEDREVIVFATGQDNVPRRDLREHYDGDLSERTPDVVSAIHHELARERCDYDWGYEYPLVVRKTDGIEDGQQYVESIVNSLMRRDLSPGQAWAYYGVEIRGHSRNQWAARCGYSDHSAVSEPLRKAHEKLP